MMFRTPYSALLITLCVPITAASVPYDDVVARFQNISAAATLEQRVALRQGQKPPIPPPSLVSSLFASLLSPFTTRTIPYNEDRHTRLVTLTTYLEGLLRHEHGAYLIDCQVIKTPGNQELPYTHIMIGYDPVGEGRIYVHCASTNSLALNTNAATLWPIGNDVAYMAFATLSPTTPPENEGSVVAYHDPSPLHRHTLCIRNRFNDKKFFEKIESFFTNPQAARKRIASGR